MTNLNLIGDRVKALQSPSAADHPDPNTFAALAANTITREQRAALLSHLALCPDCRELAFLAAPSHQPRAFRVVHWLAFAAAMLIAALVCFAPELRTLATQKRVVAVAKTQAPAIIFVPPPTAPAIPKRKPVLAAAPPILPPPPLPAIALPFPALAATRPASGVIRLSRTMVQPPANQMFQTSFLPANTRVSLRTVPEWKITPDQTALQRSIDAGVTWDPIAIPNMTGAITNIDAAVGARLQIETTTGEHWKTTDAGAHWTRTL